jgi:hypothetical protein
MSDFLAALTFGSFLALMSDFMAALMSDFWG